MNINLIRSTPYIELVNKLIKPHSWKKIIPITSYPFKENYYFKEDLIQSSDLKTFDLVSNMHTIFDIDQYVYGVLTLNGKDFIVDVDNEFQLHVVGDTESNWLHNMLYLHDNLDTFEEFMKECNKQFGIVIKQPNFDYYNEIEDKFLYPLINS
jgi:hypothetical protein